MGTIAQKIARSLDTKEGLKDTINTYLGQDITDAIPFKDYETYIKNFYNAAPKTEFEEGSDITLENTLKGKLDFEDDIVGIGDISQKSYSGKNLFPNGSTPLTNGGITFTPQADGGIKVKGTSTYANYYTAGADSQYVEVANLSNIAEAVTLSVSGMQRGIEVYVVGQNLGAKGIGNIDNNINFTTILNDNYRLIVRVLVNNEVDTTLYIQLEKGSSVTSFEKYVGGTASPNPSYTQDIEVVRGKNRLDDSNLMLFNSNKYICTTSYTTQGKIAVNPSTTYTLIYKANTINDMGMWEFDSSNNKTAISYTPKGRDYYSIRVFTTLSTTKTMSFYAGSNDTYTSVEEFLQAKELMLLEGDYSSQAIPSYLPYNTIRVKARGKNKLDFSSWVRTLMNKSPNITDGSINAHTDNSITITANGEDCFTASYTISNNASANKTFCETYPSLVQEVKENTKYTFSFERSNTSIISRPAFFFLDKDYNYLGLDDQDRTAVSSVTFTTPSNAKYMTFRVGIYHSNGSTLTISNLMIEESPSATNYEPYYTPQIKQLFLGNFKPSKIGNYKDYFYRTNGKNKFDNSVERKNAYIGASGSDIGTTITYYNSSATYSYVNCAYVESGKTYTISWKQSTTPASTNNRIGAIVDNNDIVLAVQQTWINSSTSITFTPNVSGYLVLCTDINATNIQLELGNTATDYNPFGSGEWYFKGKINNKELNGSETWALDINYNRFASSTTITDYDISNRTSALCSHYKYDGTPYFALSGSGNYLFFGFPNENTTTLETWEAWLSTNKPSVFYIKAISTDTKITDTTMISQLEEIYNLMSYTGTTILEVDGDLPLIIKTRALKGA